MILILTLTFENLGENQIINLILRIAANDR